MENDVNQQDTLDKKPITPFVMEFDEIEIPPTFTSEEPISIEQDEPILEWKKSKDYELLETYSVSKVDANSKNQVPTPNSDSQIKPMQYTAQPTFKVPSCVQIQDYSSLINFTTTHHKSSKNTNYRKNIARRPERIKESFPNQTAFISINSNSSSLDSDSEDFFADQSTQSYYKTGSTGKSKRSMKSTRQKQSINYSQTPYIPSSTHGSYNHDNSSHSESEEEIDLTFHQDNRKKSQPQNQTKTKSKKVAIDTKQSRQGNRYFGDHGQFFAPQPSQEYSANASTANSNYYNKAPNRHPNRNFPDYDLFNEFSPTLPNTPLFLSLSNDEVDIHTNFTQDNHKTKEKLNTGNFDVSNQMSQKPKKSTQQNTLVFTTSACDLLMMI
ncbi:MAG: hypothetical protein IPP74_00250 [Alphaproteobacteria bacterium]|nr:hypothetical protein [Alphaproteobacteria bacterium]